MEKKASSPKETFNISSSLEDYESQIFGVGGGGQDRHIHQQWVWEDQIPSMCPRLSTGLLAELGLVTLLPSSWHLPSFKNTRNCANTVLSWSLIP